MAATRKSSKVAESRFTKEPTFEDLDPGREFQVKGEPGWFAFISLVTDPATGDQWVDAYGGPRWGKNEIAAHRSFGLDRIKRRANGKIVSQPRKKRQTEGDGS